MGQKMITDWDDAYQNAAYIDGAEAYPVKWAAAAAQFRADTPPEVLSYGAGARQQTDLFLPDRTPTALTVYVHGGYWKAFHRHDWSHLAAGPLSLGHAVAMPSYTLAPDATVSEISAEMVAAIIQLASRIDGPIYLTGHSAGGHLVTRLACAGVLPAKVAARIAHVVSISGVHDLRPLLNTNINDVLKMSEAEAVAQSPALAIPVPGTRLTAIVGTKERPEFRRQTDLLANIWQGLGAATRTCHLPGAHHFNVIDGLAKADSSLMKLLLNPPG
jgi:arylformamidase